MEYYGPSTVSKELFYQQLVDSPPPVIAIDTETIALKDKTPIGFAIATSPSHSWWFNCLPEHDLEIQLLQSLMQNPGIKKVYANCMFDLKVQELIFQEWQPDLTNIVDILTCARLLGRAKASVATLAEEIGWSAQSIQELFEEYGVKDMLKLPRAAVAAKCELDARVTLAIHDFLEPQLQYIEGLSHDYFDVERKVIPILIDMSQRGLPIDQEQRLIMQLKMEEDQAYYRNVCEDEYDFSPGSGMQTGYVLAARGSFLKLTKGGKQYQTDEATLELLDDPLATIVLGFKKATSMLTKYLYPMADMDRLYTDYGIDTEVGRTKSSNFNMQNIPSAGSKVGIDIRRLMLFDSGIGTTGDYSQEHLRILMHFSGDREMERVYYDGEHDGDIHSATAKKIGRPRQLAKTVNYLIPYGGSPQVLATQLRTKDIKYCAGLIDDWMDAYPEAAEWLNAAARYALDHNKSLPTLFGRQIAIPDEETKWGKLNVEGMKRKGKNYPILGSDGEVMKRALIICSDYELPLAVTVHDSITCDGDIRFPVRKLESVASVHLPFEVKQSTRWE